MATTRKKFTDEFKQATVERLRAGERAVDICKELGITSSMICAWRNKFEAKRRKAKAKAKGIPTVDRLMSREELLELLARLTSKLLDK